MSQLDVSEVVEAHVEQFLPIVRERLPIQLDDAFVKDVRKFVKEAISEVMAREVLDHLAVTEENVRLVCEVVARKCMGMAVNMVQDAQAFVTIAAGLGSPVSMAIFASTQNSGIVNPIRLPAQKPNVEVVEPAQDLPVAEPDLPVEQSPAVVPVADTVDEPSIVKAPVVVAPANVLVPRPKVAYKSAPKSGSLEYYVEGIANLTFEFISNLIERAFVEQNEEAIIAFGKHILLGVPTSKNWIELINANIKVADLLVSHNGLNDALSHAERALEIQSLFGPNSRTFMEERQNFVARIQRRIARAQTKPAKSEDRVDAGERMLSPNSVNEGNEDSFDDVRAEIERALASRSIENVLAVRNKLLEFDCLERKNHGAFITLNVAMSRFFDFNEMFEKALEHSRAILRAQEARNPNDPRVGITKRNIVVMEAKLKKQQEEEGESHVADGGDVHDAEPAGAGNVEGVSGLDEIAQGWLDKYFPEVKSWERLTMEYLLRNEGKYVTRQNIWDGSPGVQSHFNNSRAYLANVGRFLRGHLSPMFEIESSKGEGTRIIRIRQAFF